MSSSTPTPTPTASINIPTESIPPELKPSCEQILKRGKELRKVDPVMSYWCCFAAANTAMNLENRTKEGTAFLVKLLDVLEEMKTQLLHPSSPIESSTITDEAAGSAYVENFAMKVFLQADDEDREGRADKSTIRKFVVSAQFIEVLRHFDPPYGLREEMEQKLRYARWKAAEIARGLREGRRVEPGPPGGEIPNPLDEIITPPFPGFAPLPSVPSPNLHPQPNPNPTGTILSPPPLASSMKPRRGSGGEGGSGGASGGGGGEGGLTLPLGRDAGGGNSRDRQRDLNVDADGDDPMSLSLGDRDGDGDAESVNSGQWSTVATPGLPVGEEEEHTFGLPIVPPLEPGSGSTGAGASGAAGIEGVSGSESGGLVARRDSTSAGAGAGKKNVRFAGPDGAPLSPAGTYATLDSYVAPGGPPPSELGLVGGGGGERGGGVGNGVGNGNGKNLPSVPSGSGNGSGPSAPPATNNSYPTPTAPPSGTSPALGPTSPAITPSSSTLRPSAPSAPSFPSTSTPSGRAHPPLAPTSSPLPPPPSGPPPQLDSKGIERCQKHARWAISALDYEDYETARGELRKALAMLGG